MKKFVFIMLLLALYILSCDGRKTKAESLKESVAKFKDSLGKLEITEYLPEKHVEVKTDTILTNGFSISIKTYTNMKRVVTCKNQVDNTLTYINNYRDWVSEVTIKKNDKVIFDRVFDANFFLENDKTIADSLHKAINNKVWIDDDFPLNKNYVNLVGGFIFPESKKTLYYDIKIDNEGKYSVQKIEN